MIRVYTIQDQEVFNRLLDKGKVFSFRNKIWDPSFRESYDWYINHAKTRCPGWERANPFWVWSQRPDLRSWKYFRDNTIKIKKRKLVLITLEISEDQVLFSDFMGWHHVLNRSYLPLTQKEDKDFDKKSKGKFYEQAPAKIKKEIIKSWDRCLIKDLNALKETKDQIIQGIVPYLALHQVVGVKEFDSINLAI